MGIQLGDHGQGYEISSVSIDLTAAPSSLTVSLWTGGAPGSTAAGTHRAKLFEFQNPDSFTVGLNEFTAPPGAFAHAGLNYFVVLSGFGASLSINETTSDNEDAGGETGATLYNDAGGDSDVLRLAVKGSRRTSGILVSTYAQPSLGDQEIISLADDAGFGIHLGAADRYLIRGVSFAMDDTTSLGGPFTNPFYLRSGSLSGARQFDLANTRDVTGLPVWTAPRGATVVGTKTYVFDWDDFNVKKANNVERTGATLSRVFATRSPVTDAPSAPGVTISSAQAHYGDIAIPNPGNPLMAIFGEPLYAMVQNLGQTDGIFWTAGATIPVFSQGFTTGPNAAGYELQGIGVNIEGSDRMGVAQVPDDAASVSVAVYSADADGKPSAKLFDLISPDEFAPGHSFFEAPPGTTLAASTSYVLVWTHLGGTSHRLQATASNSEDAGALTGFSIADAATWGSDLASQLLDADGNALEIAVYTNRDLSPPGKRVSSFDLHSDNDDPKGIWGNDETFWVANDGAGATDKLYAYNRSDGSRDSSSDFDNLNGAGNNDVRGICSDGRTMFVADSGDNKIYAYKMSDTTADSTKDVSLDSDNTGAQGLSCDGAHLWVADATSSHTTSKIFVYQRSDGTHASSLDLGAGTLSPSNDDGSINNHDQRGMWSNGATLFVVDDNDVKIYAYTLSDRTRDDDKNIDLDAANTDPEGLWFDGRVLWVVDDSDDKLYVYDLPGAQPDNSRAGGAPAVTGTLAQGQTLTADTSGVTDATDGLAYVYYHYQWIRIDGTTVTELAGETGATYTTTADDVTKDIQVRVVFDDHIGYREYPRYSPQVTVLAIPPPEVTGVALTSNPGPDNTYVIGDSVTATVTFDKAVDITGAPQLELDFDGTAKAAGCATGTNTTTMVCSYTVLVSDSAPDGVAIAANKLSGGTITETGSTTAADLDHSAVTIDAGHKVDGIRPTLVTTSPDEPKTSADGRRVLLKFSESLHSAVHANFTVSVAGTDATVENASLFVGGEVEITLAAGDAVAPGETVTIALAAGAVEDPAGNGNLALAATTVTNAVAPTVTGIALTSNPGLDNTYSIGNTVSATATFSGAVDITGSPQLELNFAGSAKAAGCATGTNTTTMVCSYTVLVSDSAPDGIAIGANKLTGGTITATGATTAADRDHSAVVFQVAHKVDGIRPTLVTSGSDAPKTSADGTKIILTFSENVSSPLRARIIIKSGTTTLTNTAAAATGTKVEVTLATALTAMSASLTVELSAGAVEDTPGSNGNLALAATTVTNAVASTPTVTEVALTSTPNSGSTYGIGQDIEATVTFSVAVDISGSVRLEMDIGGAAKAVGCDDRHEHDHDEVHLHGRSGRLGHGRYRDRGEQADRRHDPRHRRRDRDGRPRPQRGRGRQRPQGRRHPPDARHQRRQCAYHVDDRRHAGDPDVQRGDQRGGSRQDHHQVGRNHPDDNRGEHEWAHGRSHPGDGPAQHVRQRHRGARRRRRRGCRRQRQPRPLRERREQRCRHPQPGPLLPVDGGRAARGGGEQRGGPDRRAPRGGNRSRPG